MYVVIFHLLYPNSHAQDNAVSEVVGSFDTVEEAVEYGEKSNRPYTITCLVSPHKIKGEYTSVPAILHGGNEK